MDGSTVMGPTLGLPVTSSLSQWQCGRTDPTTKRCHGENIGLCFQGACDLSRLAINMLNKYSEQYKQAHMWFALGHISCYFPVFHVSRQRATRGLQTTIWPPQLWTWLVNVWGEKNTCFVALEVLKNIVMGLRGSGHLAKLLPVVFQ